MDVRKCAARPNGPYDIDAPKKCTRPTHRPSAALCRTHEAEWKKNAKIRRDAKRAASVAESA